jgi:hypothetical protein
LQVLQLCNACQSVHLVFRQSPPLLATAALLHIAAPCRAIPCLQQFPIPGHPHGLTLFDVSGHNEIYPGSKLAHFKAIHKRSGIDYEDMLFFDNERCVLRLRTASHQTAS